MMVTGDDSPKNGMPGPQASSGYSLELQSHDYPASCEVTTWGDSMCDISWDDGMHIDR